MSKKERTCRVCGCTDTNCINCIEKLGKPCHWVGADLCSACDITLIIKPLNEAEWIFEITLSDDEGPVYMWNVSIIKGSTGLCQDDEPEMYSADTWVTEQGARENIEEFILVNGIKKYKILEGK